MAKSEETAALAELHKASTVSGLEVTELPASRVAHAAVAQDRATIAGKTISVSAIATPIRRTGTRSLVARGGRHRRGRVRGSARPPLVRLLDDSQVDERLGLAHAVDVPQPVHQEGQEGLVVGTDGLYEDVVVAGGDHGV